MSTKFVAFQDQQGTWLEDESGRIIAKFYDDDLAVITAAELTTYFNEINKMYGYFKKTGDSK